MEHSPYNVLFLCTGNSARSIMAEALLNHSGYPRFSAYSAGSHPTGLVNPMALRVLQEKGIRTSGLTSKSWDRYAARDAPAMDIVITVCDNAAGETCPVWQGNPVKAHWSFPDPAAIADPEKKYIAFREVFEHISTRVQQLLGTPIERIGRVEMESALRDIGAVEPTA